MVLSLTIGLWDLWAGYATLNSIGVWSYSQRHGTERPHRQMAFKLLAVLLVPSGFLAFIVIGGGASASDKAGAGSDDPKVREAAAKAFCVPYGK